MNREIKNEKDCKDIIYANRNLFMNREIKNKKIARISYKQPWFRNRCS